MIAIQSTGVESWRFSTIMQYFYNNSENKVCFKTKGLVSNVLHYLKQMQQNEINSTKVLCVSQCHLENKVPWEHPQSDLLQLFSY